jgi:hypothetical protein
MRRQPRTAVRDSFIAKSSIRTSPLRDTHGEFVVDRRKKNRAASRRAVWLERAQAA